LYELPIHFSSRLLDKFQGVLLWYRYNALLALLNYVSGSLRNQAAFLQKATINAADSSATRMMPKAGRKVHIPTVLLLGLPLLFLTS
jgi:hypothetical protein